MTFRDRARDPIGLLIAVLIGLLLGVVLANGGTHIAVAILAGAGLAVALFALNMAFGRTVESTEPTKTTKTTQLKPPAEPRPPDPKDPAGRVVAMLRRSQDGYADIVAASVAARDPANAEEVTSLVTVAREVVDLVGQYTEIVAMDQRRELASDDMTERALILLRQVEQGLTNAAATLNQGNYNVLDYHVRFLQASITDLKNGVHQHTKTRKGSAGNG